MAFRMLLFDRAGNPLGDLSREGDELLSCTRVEEINGTHSLSVTTKRHLDEGTRALTKGFDGLWHEWVLNEPDESHESGAHATGNYKFVWSLQYDLQTTCGDVRQPGMASPCHAITALTAALDGTAMWTVGECDLKTKSQLIMAFDTAWDRLNSIVKYWGGEVDVTIDVGATGVTRRRLNLLEHVGSKVARRRFDWGAGLTSISRSPVAGPYYCRIRPYGKGETEVADDGETTFEWKLDISSVNYGRIYLQDNESATTFRVKNPNGAWEYPTKNVIYSTDDPAELLAFAREDLHFHTRPTVTYEGSVSQFAAAGMDVAGLKLGDVVQVVDRGFNEDAPLRIEERVIKIEIDELGRDDIRLTIGKLTPSIERTVAAITSAIGISTVAPYVSTFDPSKYQWDMPELGHYTVGMPDSDGFSMSVPAYEGLDYTTDGFTLPDYQSALDGISADIEGLGDRIDAIENGTAEVDWTGSGTTSPISDSVNQAVNAGISSGAIQPEGWVHQIDGATTRVATINFTT